ncbi:DUF5683 domain-containing protein [Rhodohalobacter sp. 8-1]|uniref:DUF5683 domain-containing protein n=1 Tax=Rhodohalobacter sp. 8-1 TaxID=3131972 RepID=UPI0030EECEE2
MRISFPFLINLLLIFFIGISTESAAAFQSGEGEEAASDTLSQQVGSILFKVDPDTAYVYLDADYNQVIRIKDGDKLTLPVKKYRLLVFGKNVPERRISVDIENTVTDTVKVIYPRSRLSDDKYASYAAYRWDANLMILTDPETSISVIGSNYFSIGTLRAKLPPGVHKVRFELPSGKMHEKFIELNSYQLKTVEEYFKPSKPNAIVAGIIPGVSQLYKGQQLKGITALSLMGITTGLTIHYNTKIGTAKEDFNIIRLRYDLANTEQTALMLGNQLDEIGSEVKGIRNRRNIFRVAAILVYAANIVDAFREPKNGFANPRMFNPYRDFSVDFNQEFVEARVQINF